MRANHSLWSALTAQLTDHIKYIGVDFFVCLSSYIKKSIDTSLSALLVLHRPKKNQVYLDCVDALISKLGSCICVRDIFVQYVSNQILDFCVVSRVTELDLSVRKYLLDPQSYLSNSVELLCSRACQSLPYRLDRVDKRLQHEDVVDRLLHVLKVELGG